MMAMGRIFGDLSFSPIKVPELYSIQIPRFDFKLIGNSDIKQKLVNCLRYNTEVVSKIMQNIFTVENSSQDK